MKLLRFSIAVAIAVSCLSQPLQAKGPTTRIVITAPALPRPAEITDPVLLDRFSVWSGPGTRSNGVEGADGFIVDWRAGALPERFEALPRFEVRFYSRGTSHPEESQPERLTYVVFYVPGRGVGRGSVYLPGRGEPHFALNVGTILRGVEGRWFNATDAWDQAVAGLLPARH